MFSWTKRSSTTDEHVQSALPVVRLPAAPRSQRHFARPVKHYRGGSTSTTAKHPTSRTSRNGGQDYDQHRWPSSRATTLSPRPDDRRGGDSKAEPRPSPSAWQTCRSFEGKPKPNIVLPPPTANPPSLPVDFWKDFGSPSSLTSFDPQVPDFYCMSSPVSALGRSDPESSSQGLDCFHRSKASSSVKLEASFWSNSDDSDSDVDMSSDANPKGFAMPPQGPFEDVQHLPQLRNFCITPAFEHGEEADDESSSCSGAAANFDAAAPGPAVGIAAAADPAKALEARNQTESSTLVASEASSKCDGDCDEEWDLPSVCAKATDPKSNTAGPKGCRSLTGSFINRGAMRMTLREGRSIHDAFLITEEKLGGGTFGQVFRGQSKFAVGKAVAIKKVAKKDVSDTDCLYAEIQVLGDLDHPNVLRFFDAYSDKKCVYIVTELCLGGCLKQWHRRMMGNQTFIRRVTHEITGALSHCHTKGVCHRDLKLDNILLLRNHEDSPIRIADFGLAKRSSKRVQVQRALWSQSSTLELPNSAATPSQDVSEAFDRGPSMGARLMSVKGTPGYMAPEVLKMLDLQVNSKTTHEDLFYDFRCDIWSLGCVVFALMHGSLPYTIYDVSFHVAEQEPLPELCTSSFQGAELSLDFVECCLQPDFRLRPHAQDLLQHEWFLDASRDELDRSLASSIVSMVAGNVRRFAVLSPFKRAALLAASRQLGAYEHEELRGAFQKVDPLASGSVSFLAFLRTFTLDESEEEQEVIRSILDPTSSGLLQFTDFLAASMNHHIQDRRDLAEAAFQCLDLNSDGSLSRMELEYFFDGQTVAKLATTCGNLEAAGIDFKDFLELLRMD